MGSEMCIRDSIYSYVENSNLSDYISENNLTDETYLPFSVVSRKDESGSREFIPIDLNTTTRENFKLTASDFIYIFSEYDIDFINSALLADALGLLSEEDKIELDEFYEEQKRKSEESSQLEKVSANQPVKTSLAAMLYL